MTVRSARSDGRPAWVLVAEGFHLRGGMDKANAALATYLSSQGRDVELVAYSVDPEVAALPGVRVNRATLPAGAPFLGRFHLARLGKAVARRLVRERPGTRVLVNGINCDWPDINWVHWVHQCWKRCDGNAPLWFKLKNYVDTSLAIRAERQILRGAKLIIANSERTRRDLIALAGANPERVHTIYLGTDTVWREFTPERRALARARLAVSPERPLVAFVGALGYDSRKGFDTLWRAWMSLCRIPEWNCDLVVAGGGRALSGWQSAVTRAGLHGRVTFLGFTPDVPELLAAADLLVSPVRYESYGLNVQEAICFGIPSIVSADAGVAEHYSNELRDLTLPNPEDSDDLARRMVRWQADRNGWKRRIDPLALKLRRYTWEDMAHRIVNLAEDSEKLSPSAKERPATSASKSGEPLGEIRAG